MTRTQPLPKDYGTHPDDLGPALKVSANVARQERERREATIAAQRKRSIEDGRQAWLSKARALTGDLARLVFSNHDRLDRIEWSGRLDRWGAGAEDGPPTPQHAALIEHAGRTPYGFARYGGALLRCGLTDLPATLDRLSDDTEPMT